MAKRAQLNNIATQGKPKSRRLVPLSATSRQLSRTTLLSLPDEAISPIFSHLQASDTSGTFKTPRHAFSLALTNTRLLSIFRQHITRITPETANETPPTLSPGHFVSVISLARENLRELHIPYSSTPILPFVWESCPRIEKLSVHEEEADRYFFVATARVRLPLRRLTIARPSSFTLTLLHVTHSLEELTLTHVQGECMPAVTALVRSWTPRRLELDIRADIIEEAPELLECLATKLPEIEEFVLATVDVEEVLPTPDDFFLEDAHDLLTYTKRNQESKCRKMLLKGHFMHLLNQAHPEAYVEVSFARQTFVSYKNVTKITSVPLWDSYLEEDLSNLKEIHVGADSFDPKWNEVLSNIHLSRMTIDQVEKAADLILNVDVAEFRFDQVHTYYWGWLRNVKEVRIIAFIRHRTEKGITELFSSLTSLLCQFQGKSLWMEDVPTISLLKSKTTLRRSLWKLSCALDKFEARGGDAGTIRTMVDRVKWC